MDSSHREERLADELQRLADALRDQRPTLDPLALDRVKLRAMSSGRRPGSSRTKGLLMRTRLTTLLTVGFLSLGTGGALAWVGGEHFGLDSGHGGSASFSEYHGHEGEPPGKSGEPPPGKGGPPRGLGHEGEPPGKGHDH